MKLLRAIHAVLEALAGPEEDMGDADETPPDSPPVLHLVKRSFRYALVCTVLEPGQAAEWFGAFTPGERWTPSQAQAPSACDGIDGRRHILLAKSGKTAFVN